MLSLDNADSTCNTANLTASCHIHNLYTSVMVARERCYGPFTVTAKPGDISAWHQGWMFIQKHLHLKMVLQAERKT